MCVCVCVCACVQVFALIRDGGQVNHSKCIPLFFFSPSFVEDKSSRAIGMKALLRLILRCVGRFSGERVPGGAAKLHHYNEHRGLLIVYSSV